jgi:hypothetical protein
VKGGFFVLFIKESMSYNPIPPRVWSRVQGECNHDINIPSIEKGNVLQYKKNSSSLTKQQKYSQIAKGYWTSRRKCFASQTQTYTNPNTASFKRVNSINIPFPNNIVGAPNNISGPFQYDVPNPFGCPTTVLEDGGTLLGTTYVNPCTNAVIRKTYVQNCNPTSASDVPGPIETLCWDPSVATWYPRQRLNMSNSSDKWPVGYKGFVSAITPIPPVLYYDSCQSTLYWTYEYCLPVSSVNIYKDGQFYKVVPAPLTSTPLNDLVPGQTYTFTAKSVLYGTESEVSNSVTITIPTPPVNLTSIVLSQSSAELSWDLPVGPITNFNIYQNGVLIDTVSPTTDTYVVTGLSLNTLYTFGVSIVYGCGSETTQSTTSLEITESISYSFINAKRKTVSSDPGSYYIIIENDGTDNSPITGPGQTGVVTLTITSGVPLTVNMLIVGGGGGGACGNLINGIYSGGGGGGGGGIYYNSAITIPLNTPVTINVGCAGLGRPGNSGQGNSTGASGGASSLSFNSNTYTANGGGGGFGIGGSVGGGSGGSGGTNGGGGGGGAGSDKSGPKLGGPGGSGSILPGNTGTNGTTTSAGDGGDSGISTLLLPTTIPQITLNLSGGGGGGSNSRNSAGGKGGLAGPSGLGGQNTITNGQDAIYGILSTMGYYGNGAGGAGNSGAGGKGSKGVVILWIP